MDRLVSVRRADLVLVNNKKKVDLAVTAKHSKGKQKTGKYLDFAKEL